MSQPKRYGIVCDFKAPWSKMHEFEKGEWVQYSDYAALQAEVERLEKLVGKLCFEKDQSCELRQNAEATRLQAENERLRKAGDAMADEFKFIGGGTVEGWHKARGVQS